MIVGNNALIKESKVWINDGVMNVEEYVLGDVVIQTIKQPDESTVWPFQTARQIAEGFSESEKVYIRLTPDIDADSRLCKLKDIGREYGFFDGEPEHDVKHIEGIGEAYLRFVRDENREEYEITKERWAVLGIGDAPCIHKKDVLTHGIAKLIDSCPARKWKRAYVIAAAPELLQELEGCCLLSRHEQTGFCHVRQSIVKDGACEQNNERGCHIWQTIQKARGQG